ncbi:MAG: hypothetical protein AB8G95_22390 [Anaerolineae bacterium]
MSTLISRFSSTLLATSKLQLLIDIDRDVVHQLIAWAAGHGPVHVIDCGCAFNATRTLELIHLEHVHFKQAMENIEVSRPFTAYQFKTAARGLIKHPPPAGSPIVVIGALRLLYDDNIQLGESMRLLNTLLADLQQLRQHSLIILTASPPPADMQARLCLLQAVMQTADQVIVREPPQPVQSQQLSLFSQGA